MNIKDMALLMGKTRREIEDLLKSSDVIELNLSDKGAEAEKDELIIRSVDKNFIRRVQ